MLSTTGLIDYGGVDELFKKLCKETNSARAEFEMFTHDTLLNSGGNTLLTPCNTL
jgi:hypothetical protein